MYLTVHTSLSLVIGATITNPVLAFVLAFLGHFVLDAIPHDSLKLHSWLKDKKIEETNKIYFLIEIFESVLILITLGTLYFTNNLNLSAPIIAALAGGYLPDVLWGINNLTKNKIKILQKYHLIHNFMDRNFLLKYFLMPVYMEVGVQIVCFVFFIWLYLKIG